MKCAQPPLELAWLIVMCYIIYIIIFVLSFSVYSVSSVLQMSTDQALQKSKESSMTLIINSQ